MLKIVLVFYTSQEKNDSKNFLYSFKYTIYKTSFQIMILK